MDRAPDKRNTHGDISSSNSAEKWIYSCSAGVTFASLNPILHYGPGGDTGGAWSRLQEPEKTVLESNKVKKLVAVFVMIVVAFILYYILATKACSHVPPLALSDTCAEVLKNNGLTRDSLTCAAVCTQMATTQKEAAEHTLTSDKLFQASLLHSCYREIKGSDCACGSGKDAR